jgi:hypothetical protein
MGFAGAGVVESRMIAVALFSTKKRRGWVIASMTYSEWHAKKTAARGGRFFGNGRGSMILLGVVCSVFRVVRSVLRSVGSLVGLVGSVRGGILRLVGGVAVVGDPCGRSSAGRLLGLRSRLAGSVSRGVGLVGRLHRFRGGSLRSSLLCGISSLLSRISGLLGVLRGILRAVAACRQQRDERGGE